MSCKGCEKFARVSSGRPDTVLLMCEGVRLREGERRRSLGEFPAEAQDTGEPRPAWCRFEELTCGRGVAGDS